MKPSTTAWALQPRKILQWPLAVQLIVALVLGCATGALMGSRAAVFGEIGVIVIKLLKTLATPLVFFAIVDAFCKTQIPTKSGVKLLFISSMNAVVALVIALALSNLLPIAKWVSFDQLSRAISTGAHAAGPAHLPELSVKSLIETFVPANIVDPFLSNNVIAVVFISVLLGASIRAAKSTKHGQAEVEAVEKVIAGGLRLVSKMLEWIVRLVPIAAFAIVAKVVGTIGLSVFSALGVFVLLVTAGLVLHVCVYYSFLLVAWARRTPGWFFKLGGEALLTAFSTGSSLATLPVTLRTLQEKMNVSPSSSRLAACVGTNLNHDGIILYEAVAALFVARIQAIPVSLNHQIAISVTSLLAAVGIAGVPDAGFITLSLVVGSVGLPLAAVPLLLPVDWFLGRLRATTNVTSDMIVANLLDR